MSFAGTDRYTIHRQLGSGGFGVVYQAYDRVRKERVALKVLRHVDPARLYAFKKEFRALADVTHHNLVTLYELEKGEREWFFTMELVDGVNFLEFVRTPKPSTRPPKNTQAATVILGGDELSTAPPISTANAPAWPGGAQSHEAASVVARDGEATADSLPFSNGVAVGDAAIEPLSPPRFHEERLRACFAQLVEGVRALHLSGQLHRDLKPSNALVTTDGRVVLLDFGLIKEIGADGSVDERVVGTVPYMSPEQGVGARLTEASDWYSLGVMMYRALTGKLPHVGDLYALLVAKRSIDPVPPSSFCAVPADLNELTMALLSRTPEDRPGPDEILARLGTSSTRGMPRDSLRTAARLPPLVGRDREIDEVLRAFAQSREGALSCVFLGGASGMGKTALVREASRRMFTRHDALVLSGTCFERESVPYKALDSLMDAVSSHLRQLPRLNAEQLMPREVRALARLFPTLERVQSIAGFPTRAGQVADVDELRRRAVSAMRELLARMADHRPLVLCIDDAQWGDSDSARLLGDLISEGCPGLLLVLCHRAEEQGPFVREMRRTLDRQRVATHELELAALDDEDGAALARSLLVDELADSDVDAADLQRLARVITREAAGNPFFIDELVRYVSERGGALSSSGLSVSLSEVLGQRVHRLPEGPRALLDVICVAGHPVDEAAVAAAADIVQESRRALIELRHARLVHATVDGSATTLSPFHDRIRDVVLRSCDADELASVHLRLAEALSTRPNADAEALARHFAAGGDESRANHYVRLAARQALHALAFERAASLYSQALETLPAGDGARIELTERLAESLAHAGRGPEAANAYLDAASLAQRDGVRLRCRAAEQLFFCGHIDRGTDTLREVLEAARLPPLPRTEAHALFGFLRRRAQLKVRGLAFRERATSVVPNKDLVRTDVCYSMSAVLAGVRPLTAGTMQTHHLLMALELGDLYRIVRGLGLEAIFTSMPGESAHRDVGELLEKAMTIAANTDEPEARAHATAAAGICAYFEGDWLRSRDTLEDAEVLLSEKCAALRFELGQVRSFRSLAMFYLGDMVGAAEHILPVLRDARRRQDRYVESMLVNVSYRHHLLCDRVDEARAEVARGLSGWYRGRATVQDFYERAAQVRIALYEGEGNRAWTLLEDCYGPMTRSALMRVQVIRVELRQMRAQAALSCAVHESSERRRERWLERAGKDAAKLASEDAAWARPLAELLLAAVDHQRGNAGGARERLDRAARLSKAQRMKGYAEAAKWRLAERAGTTPDATWFEAQGIQNAARFANLFAPGF